jgi:hypothetical protein
MKNPFSRYCHILFFFSILFTAQGQQPYFKIDTLTLKPEGLSFPILNNAADSSACRKINHVLQLSELHLLFGQQKKNAFEKITSKKANHYVSGMSFKIATNNSRMFSVSFSESGDPIVEWWSTYYNFNSVNGSTITLSNLFNVKGYADFKKMVNEQRTSQLLKFLNSGKDSIVVNYKQQLLDNFQKDDLSHFIMKDSSVVIYLNGMSVNKYDFLYLKNNIVGIINLSEFRNLLNEYGKSLFGIIEGK